MVFWVELCFLVVVVDVYVVVEYFVDVVYGECDVVQVVFFVWQCEQEQVVMVVVWCVVYECVVVWVMI